MRGCFTVVKYIIAYSYLPHVIKIDIESMTYLILSLGTHVEVLINEVETLWTNEWTKCLHGLLYSELILSFLMSRFTHHQVKLWYLVDIFWRFSKLSLEMYLSW